MIAEVAGIKQHVDVHDKILKCYANIVLMCHCHRRHTKIDFGRPNDFVVMFLCYSRNLVSAKGGLKFEDLGHILAIFIEQECSVQQINSLLIFHRLQK